MTPSFSFLAPIAIASVWIINKFITLSRIGLHKGLYSRLSEDLFQQGG